MAKASSDIEIEDVLSSIRRLVSQSAPTRPAIESSEPPAARPQLLYGGISSEPAEQPAAILPDDAPLAQEADRLVLTPSLRVTQDNEAAADNAAQEAWPSESPWLRGVLDETPENVDAPFDETAVAEPLDLSPEEDFAEENIIDFVEAEDEEVIAEATVTRIFASPPAPALEPSARGEPSSATLPQEPEGLSADVQESHALQDDAPDEPTFTGAFDFSSEAETGQFLSADPRVVLRSGRRRLHLADSYLAAPAPMASAAEACPETEAELACVYESDAALAGSASAPAPADDLAWDPDSEEKTADDAHAGHAYAVQGDAPSDEIDHPSSASDGAAMSRLMAEVLRRELQGQLGERITRNMRLLVRREIERALATRDIE